MQLKHAVPSGLKNRQCEQFDPIKMGGLPHIRFVATARKDEPEDKGKTKKNYVKIKINDRSPRILESSLKVTQQQSSSSFVITN